jgi:hypothetical protein
VQLAAVLIDAHRASQFVQERQPSTRAGKNINLVGATPDAQRSKFTFGSRTAAGKTGSPARREGLSSRSSADPLAKQAVNASYLDMIYVVADHAY